MADNALQKFLIKRVLIFFIVLLIINLIFLDQRWLIAIGLICGTIFGILKFLYTSNFITSLISIDNKSFVAARTLVKFMLAQMATLVLIAVSIKFNMWFFAGVLTGVLLIPAVIMVNSITEALHISHNKFQ
ncbi:hypothetical protein [Acetivibrio cellulolyticus]|uniref:hypothetical protein n=1 Tax=Acetivibrio cellulolyticus TaxID=35830 RepID=UPI0001E2CC19|nr:hypothetical protein [Acetivibrio cellulolyticus]